MQLSHTRRSAAAAASRPGRRRPASLRTLAIPFLLTVVVSGCGFVRALGNPDVDGYGDADAQLRRRLLVGGFDAALQDLNRAAPRDELLRDMYAGLVAHYAGRYEESSAALERAADVAEARVATQSLTRAGLSAISSDLAMLYEPLEAERLLIHYYNALNYVRRGLAENAAVEARRLAKLLEQLEDAGIERGLVESPALRAFVGAVFAANGEREDAEVAFRQAAHLAGDSTLFAPHATDSLADVFVLVERGFVPHRAEQSLNVLLSGEDVAVFGSDSDEKDDRAFEIAARVLSAAAHEQRYYESAESPGSIFVTAPPAQRKIPSKAAANAAASCAQPAAKTVGKARVVSAPAVVRHPGDTARVAPPPEATSSDAPASSKAQSGCAAPHKSDDDEDDDDLMPYLLRMAWPVFVGRTSFGGAAVAVGDMDAPLAIRADVGAAVIDDFESRRAQLLARTVVRAAAKAALSKTVEKEIGRKNEDVGKIFGLLTNASAAALERADTRSWHLLPGSIGVARVRLPAGTHEVAVRLGSGDYARRVVAGTAKTRGGGVTILSTRVWQ